MDVISELQERLDRYERVFTPEMLKTIREVDVDLGLEQPSGILLKAGIDSDAILVLSGMRDYSVYLKNLVESTKAALEIAQQQEKQEDE